MRVVETGIEYGNDHAVALILARTAVKDTRIVNIDLVRYDLRLCGRVNFADHRSRTATDCVRKFIIIFCP